MKPAGCLFLQGVSLLRDVLEQRSSDDCKLHVALCVSACVRILYPTALVDGGMGRISFCGSSGTEMAMKQMCSVQNLVLHLWVQIRLLQQTDVFPTLVTHHKVLKTGQSQLVAGRLWSVREFFQQERCLTTSHALACITSASIA